MRLIMMRMQEMRSYDCPRCSCPEMGQCACGGSGMMEKGALDEGLKLVLVWKAIAFWGAATSGRSIAACSAASLELKAGLTNSHESRGSASP